MSAVSKSHVRAAGKPAVGLLIAAFALLYSSWGGTYLAIRIGIESIPPLLMVVAFAVPPLSTTCKPLLLIIVPFAAP